MDRASERVRAGAFLGAAILAVGMVLPASPAEATASTDGIGVLAPSLGCGPAETLVGTRGLLARVRADARAPAKPSAAPGRGRAASAAQAHGVPARKAVRRPSEGPRNPGRKALPRLGEQEPRPVVLRSFYTCDAAPNLTEGTGWRLVGPLRQG